MISTEKREKISMPVVVKICDFIYSTLPTYFDFVRLILIA